MAVHFFSFLSVEITLQGTLLTTLGEHNRRMSLAYDSLHYTSPDTVGKSCKVCHLTQSSQLSLYDINRLRETLTSTREREKDSSLPMLEMSILNEKGSLSSTWYIHGTDSPLVLKERIRDSKYHYPHMVQQTERDWAYYELSCSST